MKRTMIIALTGLLFTGTLYAQDQGPMHGRSRTYTPPAEKEVQEKLEQWRDLKFGMLIHWGLYSELGVVESWSICSEEEDWIKRDSTVSYEQYKRDYWAVSERFNPVGFDPAGWASAGRSAGMKYVVFTTKHHDGFCMFDTKQTDFSIMNGPFGKDPRANVSREVFGAFREQGYWVGAYFSKPDWHSQYYWWDRYATPNRSNNYDIDKNPWRWEQFREFTHKQIEEIVCGDYGPLDILWLDGGWVRPPLEGRNRPAKGWQDIDMPRLAAMVRGYQPDIIMVDRSVAGPYENYQTPERGIPDTYLENPWESCITLGNDWGWVPDDPYKSPAQVVHMLVEIVAKGGNLILGIGPKPDGTLPEEVVWRLEKIGEWVTKNGKAIYGTRPPGVIRDGNTWFTRSRDNSETYAIVCLPEGEKIPRKVVWKGNEPVAGSQVYFIGSGKPVSWKKTPAGIEVTVPRGLPADQPALAFSFEATK